MTEFDRRTIIGGAALAGAALSASVTSAAPQITPLSEIKKEADIACIYHCDFGDAARFNQLLNNISNHYAVYNNPLELQLSIVAHSVGLKFFLDPAAERGALSEAIDPTIFQRVKDLSKNGMKVYLCNITFERQKISVDAAQKADFIRIVPSGVATLAALQSKGFAYIKVG
jgi:uncharacterized protein